MPLLLLLAWVAAHATEPAERVLIRGDADLHIHPDEDSEALHLGMRAADIDPVWDAVRAAYLGEADGWTHVRSAVQRDEPTRPVCPASPRDRGWPSTGLPDLLELDLWVRSDQLQRTTTTALSLEGGDLTVLAGVPVVRGDDGRDVLWVGGWWVHTTLPAGSTGTRWSPSTVTRWSRTGVRVVFPVGEPVPIGGSVATHAPDAIAANTGATLPAEAIDADRARVHLPCATFVTPVTRDAQAGGPHLHDGGVYGGVRGGVVGGWVRDSILPDATPLTWLDGTPAGRTVGGVRLDTPRPPRPDGRVCFVSSAIGVGSAYAWPAVNLCADAAALVPVRP